ncbi:MAG TPA: glycosyltransferase family 2 protein [Candidatus Dormibacteraeota bacterium]|nr:glycosyltransferase family 2 protein [Candidatus Dormibacteraeota bacterium]
MSPVAGGRAATWPRITIVTPCLNARHTIEQTLASVREQDYPDLEHLVIDGGSTDGTLAVLAAADGIQYVSAPDRGLSDAVNKGVEMATGELMGWLNADDLYLPGALRRVGRAHAEHDRPLWVVGGCIIIAADGSQIRRPVTAYKDLLLRGYSLRLLLTQNFVSAPSTFVSRAGFERVGRLDEALKYSMDYDIWLRLARLGPPLIVPDHIAAFRMAEGSLSMTGFELQFKEHNAVARRHGQGKRVAVGANAVTSRAIVGVYRALAWRRARRRA